jgi:hypothetical protein
MAPERTNQFKILLSDQELTVLKEIAEQRGVTSSDVLRLYIREQGALLVPQPGVAEKLVKDIKRRASPGPAAEQIKRLKESTSLRGAPGRKPKK